MGKQRTQEVKPVPATPAGPPPVATVEPSQCIRPACRSTAREPYHGIKRHQFAGVTPDGRKYSVVVWRRTRCLDCGQARVDRSFE